MKMNSRMLMRIVAIAIALGIFGWQWWSRQHKQAPVPAAETSAAASTVTEKPVKPAPPATIKLGRLTLTACELKAPHSSAGVPAFCAKFPVPENRADPKSRTIDLKVAIVKSDSAVPEKDMVAYLAGGPGQSATETFPQLAAAFAPLQKHHDILVLDQRGTGGSHALSCPEVEKAQMGQENLPFDAARVKANIAKCLAEVEKHADPRYYTTTIAVADLEAVRQALGAPKFDLVGISYGTRMAQQYATAHPDAVRSIVLDSVAPNTLILGETFASDLERALQLQSEACLATPACKQAFGDWRKTLLDLHARLQAKPVENVSFRDPRTNEPVTRNVTGDTLAGLVHLFAYNAEASALLPLDVAQAAKGNYAPLLGQTQIGEGDLSGNMNGGMQLSVMCSEDAPFLTPRPEDAGTLLGTQAIERIQAACSVWPRGEVPKDFHQPFKSSIPTLILSGERDPVTPPRFAEEVLKGLSNGRVLELKGMGHGELTIGCMPKVVTQFVDKLDPKQLDAGCLKRIGPIPAFVNFNGAAP
ncbi:MAG: alpha/beta fold hydrolase [Rhodanobacteraceae bacterium]|jgi:pimeloyl-ACP methyl ester carboxylesterase|nr:MAG: alpha/beta fold hydrolase [Rhodanobacteraceae bacterium]